ncbi:hypothetical protein BIW11_12866 [Tropilaelaps mercedesae]|uniref:Uncharacterized protein n=1 Tax=Tropilaelaps mercedesae TaxID=418985 RepID=A0A1V9X535_9ACAR|nr:hypothetical protein BIW11_12866 [Tropilaelaps mercedesae]
MSVLEDEMKVIHSLTQRTFTLK